MMPSRIAFLSRRFLTVALAAGSWFFAGIAVNGQADKPESARQLYNNGTWKLHSGKLRDAENLLQSAVASQDEHVQVAALYNLGFTRFHQGLEELKNAKESGSMRVASGQALGSGDEAIRAADEALAGEDTKQLVSAYLRGRGARKELKAARAAVRKALNTYATTLNKWQRSLGDFRGTLELKPGDDDAKRNAEVLDRCIAKLIDLQNLMMQNMQGMKEKRDAVKEKMGQLKAKIPQDMGQQPGGKGDDDDDDDDDDKPGGTKQTDEPKPGTKEPEAREGKEMVLTPEEATRLLGMLKLDSERKLPLGASEKETKPKPHPGRDW